MKHKLLLCLLLMIAATTATASSFDFEVDGIYYKIIKDNEAEVTSEPDKYTGDVTIPETVTYAGVTYAVAAIDKTAFWNCTSLTSVTIPSSVTSIADGAFYNCCGLKNITVDSGNPIYDSRDNCNALIETASNTLIVGCQNTFISNSVSSIGSYAFYNCPGLTSVIIPNSVISIGYSAFSDCDDLKSITIGNSVTTIGTRAFAYCHGLTSVTIPNSVISIASCVFDCCDGLTSITVESGNSWYDSRDNCNAIIETVRGKLITGCQNTTIPNSVTSIEEHAFYGCSGLTSITIPASVASIGDEAFYGCDDLTSITVERGNPWYDSRDNCNALIETASNVLIMGCQNTIIPNTVTRIGGDAFHGCRNLTNITIPNSVTVIGTRAFAFCSGLRSIDISNSVAVIDSRAFYVCRGLVSITIPSSVTSIGYNAFAFCGGLKDVYCYITDLANVKVGDKVFEDFRNNYFKRTLHVPAGTAGQYQSSFSWYPYFRKIVEMSDLNCDVNVDGSVNIADVNQVIDTILSGDQGLKGDVNGDGVVNISDINVIINYILTN